MKHVLIRTSISALAIGLALVGCATTGSGSSAGVNDGSVAEKRAIERWDLLIKGQAEKAYDYLSPGTRAVKKREEYAQEMNNRPVRWSKVSPSSKKCESQDLCSITLQVDYVTRMPGVSKDVKGVGFTTETWIRDKGKWWVLPDAKRASKAD